MKGKALEYLAAALLALLSACDVHEFPELREKVAFTIRLSYDTEFTQWEHHISAARSATSWRGVQPGGEIRYVVRLYPHKGGKPSANPRHEYVFTRDAQEGCDTEFAIEAVPGEYTVMVWSDFAETPGGDTGYYDIENFLDIRLREGHTGNTDRRDAFRGTCHLALDRHKAAMGEVGPTIKMRRPLAKFEFVTTDVREFMDKMAREVGRDGDTKGTEKPSKSIDLGMYRVVFYYVGFMPTAYSIFSDKPVDATTGAFFEGRLLRTGEAEASMGFDYVFVNGGETSVTLQVALFDKEGARLSLSEPVNVPLRRSRHTIVRGKFLMQEAAGGVRIDPSYYGDHNITL